MTREKGRPGARVRAARGRGVAGPATGRLPGAVAGPAAGAVAGAGGEGYDGGIEYVTWAFATTSSLPTE
jgi:hypothetical protein